MSLILASVISARVLGGGILHSMAAVAITNGEPTLQNGFRVHNGVANGYEKRENITFLVKFYCYLLC